MKKVLWAVSALAVAGLCFTGCDEEDLNNVFGDPEEWSPVDNDKYCDGTCGTGENVNAPNCFTKDITKTDKDSTYCLGCKFNCALKFASAGQVNCVAGDAVLGGGWGCAALGECPAGQGFKVAADGTAKCETLSTNTCSGPGDCTDTQHCDADQKICVDNEVEENTQYTIVRITDKSDGCTGDKLNSKGLCKLDDPGADIDAVALVKQDNSVSYASEVMGYLRGDVGKQVKTIAEFKAATEGKEIVYTASDPTRALGKPDSLVSYAGGKNVDGSCIYWLNKDDKENRVHPYVSLGGNQGWIELAMDGVIEAGDRIDVLEVGACAMKETDNADGSAAQSEEILVEIAIADDEESWVSLGENKASADNKGVLSFTVSGAKMKK